MYSKTADPSSRPCRPGTGGGRVPSSASRRSSRQRRCRRRHRGLQSTPSPASRAQAPKPSQTSWVPGSEWWISPAWGRRRCSAISSASTTRSAHVVGHRPAHDPPAIGVLDGNEVQPTLPAAQIGDVREPQHVGPAGSELALDEVIGDPDARDANRGWPRFFATSPEIRALASAAPRALARPGSRARAEARRGSGAPHRHFGWTGGSP